MGKRIFLTGAAGFIGYHVAQALHLRGDKVVGFDNFNPYYPVSLKRDRAKMLKTLGIDIIEGDLCEAAKLQSLVQQTQATHIVHLAAQAGVRHSLKAPQDYVTSNLQGFANILEICRHLPGIKLIYASSSSVYGLNDKIPFAETDQTDQQANLYGATKKANELMAFSYHHLFHIPVTGLRFFTVYGPWGRPDMAYYAFTEAILKGETIKVFNKGNMERDFTYIDDIVSGTLAAIDLGASCEIFNLGNHQPVTLMEMITILEKTIGKKAKLNPLPMQPGDVPKTYASIKKSQEHLGFYPKTSLKEGLPRFVEWYRSYENSLIV